MLSELHDKAPVHSWEASKAAIETAFGQPVEQLFESIDHSAIASGSIAQVRTQQLDPVSPVIPLVCSQMFIIQQLFQPTKHSAIAPKGP